MVKFSIDRLDVWLGASHVLKSVDMKINTNEVLGVIGPSNTPVPRHSVWRSVGFLATSGVDFQSVTSVGELLAGGPAHQCDARHRHDSAGDGARADLLAVQQDGEGQDPYGRRVDDGRDDTGRAVT